MKINNGLPQRSALAPLLFSYFTDMPDLESIKFGYADDWVLVIQHGSIEITERRRE